MTSVASVFVDVDLDVGEAASEGVAARRHERLHTETPHLLEAQQLNLQQNETRVRGGVNGCGVLVLVGLECGYGGMWV